MLYHNILLIDYGASNVKAILWDMEKNKEIYSFKQPSPIPSYGIDGSVTCNAYDYIDIFHKIFSKINQYDIDAVWLCTEMHGIVIQDGISPPLYHSWKSHQKVKMFLPETDFLFMTGMKYFNGLPIKTLKATRNSYVPPISIFSLADWISFMYTKEYVTSKSLAAGTGLFSINSLSWKDKLIEHTGYNLDEICIPEIVPDGRPLGYMTYGHINGSFKTIPIYGGIGDLQASILGTSYLKEKTFLINMGTGSQIILPYKNPDLEQRILQNDIISVITHIPSKRIIDMFTKIIDYRILWEELNSLPVEKVLLPHLSIDIDVLEGGIGSICGITEDTFNIHELARAIAYSWLSQYTYLVQKHDSLHTYSKILLSGGMARLPFVKPFLEERLRKEVILTQTETGEETLDGLLYLARELERSLDGSTHP